MSLLVGICLLYTSDIKERIYPVGRLDFDTTGLIIMSNDGEFANMIMPVSYTHLFRHYRLKVKFGTG